MARHRAAPDDGGSPVARVPGGDRDSDGDPGEPSAPGAPLGDPGARPEAGRDTGRISPWLIGALVFAVAVFVGGVVWAVTSPSHTDAAPPAAGSGADSAIQAGQDGGTGTPLPSPAGSSHRPGTSASPVDSASPSGARSPSASTLAAPAGALTAQVSIENHWGPNNIQVSVEVVAHASGVTGWRVQLLCAGTGGYTLAVFNVWSAGVAANSGTAATFTNASWNGALTPESPTYFGFQATWGPADQQTQAVPACSAAVTTT